MREARDRGAREVADRPVAGADLHEAAVRDPEADVFHDLAAERVRQQRLRQLELVVQEDRELARLPLRPGEVERADLLAAGAVREQALVVGDADLVHAQFPGERPEAAARLVRIAPPGLVPHLEDAVAHGGREAQHAAVDALADVDRHRRGERERHRSDEAPGQAPLPVRPHGALLSAMAASSAALSTSLPFRTAMPKFSRVCSGEAAIAPPDSSATIRAVQLS